MTLAENGAPPPVDPRIAHSRRALKDALVELTKTVSAEKISVSALCKAAGVSRPTFYQHFTDVDDVYSAFIEDRLDRFGEELRQTVSTGASLESLISQMMARLDEAGPRYIDVLGAGGVLPRARKVVHHWISAQCAQIHYGRTVDELTTEEHYRVSFLTGGVMSVLGERIMHPDALTPEELTVLLRGLAATALGEPPDRPRQGRSPRR